MSLIMSLNFRSALEGIRQFDSMILVGHFQLKLYYSIIPCHSIPFHSFLSLNSGVKDVLQEQAKAVASFYRITDPGVSLAFCKRIVSVLSPSLLREAARDSRQPALCSSQGCRFTEYRLSSRSPPVSARSQCSHARDWHCHTGPLPRTLGLLVLVIPCQLPGWALGQGVPCSCMRTGKWECCQSRQALAWDREGRHPSQLPQGTLTRERGDCCPLWKTQLCCGAGQRESCPLFTARAVTSAAVERTGTAGEKTPQFTPMCRSAAPRVLSVGSCVTLTGSRLCRRTAHPHQPL